MRRTMMMMLMMIKMLIGHRGGGRRGRRRCFAIITSAVILVKTPAINVAMIENVLLIVVGDGVSVHVIHNQPEARQT